MSAGDWWPVPESLRVRHPAGQSEPEQAHERQPVVEQELGPVVGEIVLRLDDEDIPFFAFSPEICRVIHTTNAVEGFKRVIRKAIKARGSFPSKEVAQKLIYLAIRRHEKTARTVRGWLIGVPVSHSVAT